MKMKNVWMFLVALMGVMTWTSCEEEDTAPAVGITAISVTPAGSAVSYNAAINGGVATVNVPGGVEESALAAATVNATPTMGTVVYFNEAPLTAEVTVDFTAPVVLVAKGADGTSKTYTITVVRTDVADGDMVIKSSNFMGFPEGLIDYDVAYFKGKFYAVTTSVVSTDSVTVEHYDVFTSADGVNWSKVNYQVSTEGVELPEGQDGYVVGGEGASLLVHNDRLYVLGGARLKGEDIYGNPSEIVDWGFGPLVSLDYWRSFSTADGETFKCDTVGISVTREGEASYAGILMGAHLNAVSFKGKMFIQGGFVASFGQWQLARRYAASENGTDWNVIVPTGAVEGVTPDVNLRAGNAFFEFNGKLWCMGGFKNFPDASMMANTIWSSEDGLAWTQEALCPLEVGSDTTMVEGLSNLYNMEVLATDEVVYVFGGTNLTAETGNVVSNKIYKSTDCIHWEEVEAPAEFTARRHIMGVARGNDAWLFGGISDASTSLYGFPLEEPFTRVNETWVKLMN